jgi:eukaryotic translation initiation factor 2C
MIKHAVNPPGATAGTIVNRGLPTLGLSPGALQGLMDEFGLTISGEMAVIPARELPFPVVKYGSGVPKVNWGSWNILDVTFHRGATVKNWWLMVVRDPNMEGGGTNDIDPSVQQLCDRFAKKCSASGMDFTATKPVIFSTSPLPPPRKDPFRNNAIDIIRQTIKGKLIEAQTKPCFILVLLSGIDNHIYPGIKRIGDVELGVHTVCMITSKVFKDPKKQDQYLSNVALKLNTKLGGVNHLLDQKSTSWLAAKKTKTMLVGIDVTHPGRSSVLGTPSIAAMVASVDDDMVQFPASVKLQNSNKVKEVIEPFSHIGYKLTRSSLAHH